MTQGRSAASGTLKEDAIKTIEDRIASVFFLVCSCLIMIESVRLKLDQIQEPGPGFVPFFLGLALAVLSVIALIFPSPQKKAVAFWNDWQKGAVHHLHLCGASSSTCCSSRSSGFYIGTFLLMFFLLKMFGETGYQAAPASSRF